MKWKIIRNSITNWLKLEAKLIQNGFKMEPKMRLASWLANWLAGWLAASLAGGSRDRSTRANEGNTLRLGPWGETYGRGAAGNRHSLAAAGRTAAMLRGLLLLLRETAAEKNCC